MHSKQKTVRDVARLLSSLEQPLDAQIARKLILYTHEAREAKSIWEYAWDQPLTTDPVVAWKYSNLLHRLLRDAHPQAIQDSLREFSKLKYLCECWMQNAHNFTGIGHCVTHYMLLLMQKMQLHANYSHLNGRLEVFGEDKHDVNTCFQLCADLLDLMESTLRLQQAILTEIQQNRIQFDSNAGKCRLVVLITIAQEYEDVYACVLYSMRKLCCELSMDDVSGLRERFEMLFGQLHLAFQDLQCITYVMDIVQLPVLPANLPTIFNYVRDVNPEPIPSAPLAYDIDY